MPKVHNNKIKILELYKGINKALFLDLPINKQRYILSKTIKELSLIAETGYPGAGEKLYNLLEEIKPIQVQDIESLLEYGKMYSELNKAQKKFVDRYEVQQEFGHFSRIMNLDGVITGNEPEPKDIVMDFSRFLQLTKERRNDRKDISLSSWGRPVVDATHFVTNSPSCGLMDSTSDDNTIALLGVKNNTQDFHPKKAMIEYNNLINRFDAKTSTYLFDYFLYLSTHNNLDFAFVVAHKKPSLDGVIEITGNGGCGVLITIPDKKNFYKVRVYQKFTVGDKHPWSFAKQKQSLTEHLSIDDLVPNATVYLFHPNSWQKIKDLNKNNLESILNKQHKNGWFNQSNSLKHFLNELGVNSQIISMRLKKSKIDQATKTRKSVQKSVKEISESSIFQILLSAKIVQLETGHLHADRDPGEEQWDCIEYTNEILKSLKKNGFKGKVQLSTMIDEYHVVNRLDYKNYLNKLNMKGINVSEVIMESSPLIRFIAIDVLKYLSNKENLPSDVSVTKKGGNIYLEFLRNGSVIELLADAHGKPIIGCVLFDVSLCLYKFNPDYYINKYNKYLELSSKENINDILLNYYNKESSPVKRHQYMESFFVQIPTWESMIKNKSDKLVFPKSNTVLLNVLAHFYKPQQKKVNMFLKVLKQNPLYSLFYNSETKETDLV